MYGIVLVIVLIVTGGAIAFIGDRLGTKVGKKKLSIFGLRPRHTSIIFTIVTGMLITGLTIGIVALSSQNVRTALFGMEKLNQQIKASEDNLVKVTNELQNAAVEREKNLAALKEVQEQLDKAQLDAEKAQADAEAARTDLAASQQQVSVLEETRMSLEAERSRLEERINSLNSEQQALENDVDKLKNLAQRLNMGLQIVRQGDIIYRAGELIFSDGIADSENNEAKANALRDIFVNANQLISNRLGLKESAEIIWISQAEYAEALNELSKTDADMIVRLVSAGNIVAGEPVRVHIEMYRDRLVYKHNQPVYSESLDMNGKENHEEIVFTFLKNVNEQASKQGIIPDSLKGTVGVMTGSQFYQIVNELQRVGGKVEITAYAAEDTNASGPLKLNVEIRRRE